MESIYQEFLDEVYPEKLGETPPNCSKVISRLNRELVQLDIYDENTPIIVSTEAVFAFLDKKIKYLDI